MLQYTLNDMEEVVEYLSKECGKKSEVLVFDGEMGAGKTTLIKALCDNWGVEDVVSSPTFSIVNEYENLSGEKIYHFDFYRVESEAEAERLDLETYFYSGNRCLIEWASRIPNLIPDNYVIIEIVIVDENTRFLEIKRNGE